MVPTRELALQTSQIAIELSKHLGIKVMVTTGTSATTNTITTLLMNSEPELEAVRPLRQAVQRFGREAHVVQAGHIKVRAPRLLHALVIDANGLAQLSARPFQEVAQPPPKLRPDEEGVVLSQENNRSAALRKNVDAPLLASCPHTPTPGMRTHIIRNAHTNTQQPTL